MNAHNHVSSVLEWGLDHNTNFAPVLYGCTGCAVISKVPLSNGNITKEHTHKSYTVGCFACKVETLHLNTGDANSGLTANGWTEKKWDRELDLYKSARKQGIQPDGTSTAKIQKALDISDKTGVAYGS